MINKLKLSFVAIIGKVILSNYKEDFSLSKLLGVEKEYHRSVKTSDSGRYYINYGDL